MSKTTGDSSLEYGNQYENFALEPISIVMEENSYQHLNQSERNVKYKEGETESTRKSEKIVNVFKKNIALFAVGIIFGVVAFAVGIIVGYFVIGSGTASAGTPPTANPLSTTCLNSTDCWVRYDFPHDEIFIDCFGARYVRWLTSYRVFIGVRDCGEKRYHVFLARKLKDKFSSLGSDSGNGSDQCELLGGLVYGLASSPSLSLHILGFSRSGWNDPIFQVTNLGSGSSRPQYVSWVTCPGVDIPGNLTVENIDGREYPASDREYYVLASVKNISGVVEIYSRLYNTQTWYYYRSNRQKDSEVYVIALESNRDAFNNTIEVVIKKRNSESVTPIRLVLLQGPYYSFSVNTTWNITTDVPITEIYQGPKSTSNLPPVMINKNPQVVTTLSSSILVGNLYGPNGISQWAVKFEAEYGDITTYTGMAYATQITIYL